jgi:glycosyltransferase involved in cell wall biosynthesis
MKMIAENAYKKVVKNYTWDKIAKKYEVIFNNLLNEK